MTRPHHTFNNAENQCRAAIVLLAALLPETAKTSAELALWQRQPACRARPAPPRFTDAPAPALTPSPFLNQHEEEVLGGIFGFSAAERAALREAGAISVAGPVKG